MCDCNNISIGSYSNQVEIDPYKFNCMKSYIDNKISEGLAPTVCIDKCIVDKVIFLWENGVKTFGSCCGHNKLQGFINVGEDFYEKALTLGFEPYIFDEDPLRKDTVKA